VTSKDIYSSNLTYLNDLESMGLGSNIESILYRCQAILSFFYVERKKWPDRCKDNKRESIRVNYI
jgi:hypothetical protein